MERDERAVAILRRKLRAGIEHEVHWRPMRRESRYRRSELGAAPHGFPVAAVLGVEDKLLLPVVVEAIGPAEVGTRDRAIEGLRRPLCVFLRREFSGPQGVDRVAILHSDK